MMAVPNISALRLSGIATAASRYDALCIVHAGRVGNLSAAAKGAFPAIGEHLGRLVQADRSFPMGAHLITDTSAPGGRVIVASTGSLDGEAVDVRIFADAAGSVIRRARNAGARRPLLHLTGVPSFSERLDSVHRQCLQVALLGALYEMYDPIQKRELDAADPNVAKDYIEEMGIVDTDELTETESMDSVLNTVTALENARRLARDIGGADPERMSPPNCADMIVRAFSEFPSELVSVQVESDPEVLKAEYPLLAAVARASLHTPRHAPRVVRIEYRSPNQTQVTDQLHIVGKGITYDTGGADVKVGGAMRGMSRDKCGAAAVAGFLYAAAQLQPKHVNITAYLSFVRNSIGADSYVSDEVITSRAGIRVLVGNTDAEGRMVMADPLSRLREESRRMRLAADEDASPVRHCLMTCATLTGHVIRAYGNYGAIVPNAAANQDGWVSRLTEAAEEWGDPFEVSRLRREDLAFIKADTRGAAHICQSNSQPSTMTARGHQKPGAFIMAASGILAENERELDPVSFMHLDIAGAAEEASGFGNDLPRVTGNPVVALSAAFLGI